MNKKIDIAISTEIKGRITHRWMPSRDLFRTLTTELIPSSALGFLNCQRKISEPLVITT